MKWKHLAWSSNRASRLYSSWIVCWAISRELLHQSLTGFMGWKGAIFNKKWKCEQMLSKMTYTSLICLLLILSMLCLEMARIFWSDNTHRPVHFQLLYPSTNSVGVWIANENLQVAFLIIKCIDVNHERCIMRAAARKQQLVVAAAYIRRCISQRFDFSVLTFCR